MKRMEFRDLKTQYQKLKPEIDQKIQEVLNQANFISGAPVKELEEQLADYVGVKYCETCGNGTDALALVLKAWEIGPGDAVFVPDFTFFASGEVVVAEGAMPVFVDVREDTFNIDPVRLEEAIIKVKEDGHYTPKVIIAVDLFGLPADYPAIRKIAKKYGLKILEDGAQGFGGMIGNQRACSFGDAGTTSFFPAKPLGCYGDGGAVFTDDEETAKIVSSLKVHGKGTNKYDNVRIGMNSRLDTIQAAILQVKLKAFINYELDAANQVARWYDESLKNTEIKTPVIPEEYLSSWAQYTVRLSEKNREEIKESLEIQGIPAMIYYLKPMHKQKAFCDMVDLNNDFSITDDLCRCVLSLPIDSYETLVDVTNITNLIK